MLIVVMASNIAIIVSYGLISAWVGLGVCAVAVCRDSASLILYLKRKPENRNKTTKLDYGLIALWMTTAFVVTLFVHEGFLTWFAFFASFIFMISIWQKNPLVYRILGVLTACCGIIYKIAVQSLFGIILESCLLAAIIVGLLLYIWTLTKARHKSNVLT